MPHATSIKLKTPPGFDLASVLNCHGWSVLPPNIYDPLAPSLSRVELLPYDIVARINIHSDPAGNGEQNVIFAESPGRITQPDKVYILQIIRHMLRLDEDYEGFYRICRRKGGFWKSLIGRGRMLR